MHRRALAALLSVWCAPSLVSAQALPEFGTVETVATVPATPGFPEGIVVRGRHVYVATPAALGDNSGTGPSVVQVFDREGGGLVDELVVEGENLAAPHFISGLAFDGDGRLYVTSSQLGVLRFDTGSGEQELYSPQPPALPPCPADGACTPNPAPRLPTLNDLAFDVDGSLFLTDSTQATIWRVAPGGGPAEIFFQDARLGGFFGANGIRLDPTRNVLYITVSIGPAGGALYQLPVENPSADALEMLHFFPDVPDGVQVGRDGDLYVALAASNTIAILDPDGTERARLPNALSNETTTVPFDGPSALAFDHRGWVYFTNHAVLSGNAANFAVLRVWTGDHGDPLETPFVP